MMKPAFSTVACPEWTLRQVAERARTNGFEAVELRTFGDDSRLFACDPALTSDQKTRTMFGSQGVEVLCLATSVRFDEPIFPPVIGYLISDTEKSVRQAKRAIDLAVAIECPFVRIFGFELPAREKRSAGLTRIADRLRMAADHADRTGVRIVVENGGSFPGAADLMELINLCGSPLVGACYSPAAAAVGPSNGHAQDPAAAVATLGDRLWVARIKDARAGVPCGLGEGELRCREFVRALGAAGFNGPIVFEWDRAWNAGLSAAETVLPVAAAKLFEWIGADAQPSKHGAVRAAQAPHAVR